MINELDLISEIVTVLPLQIRFLKQYTELNKALYCKIKMWFPFKNRDFVARVTSYDLLEELDEVLLWGHSVAEHELKGVDVPKVDCKTARMDISVGEMVIKPRVLEDGQLVSFANARTKICKNIVRGTARTAPLIPQTPAQSASAKSTTTGCISSS